jgi:prepilin-type N-terminal cleavage/methylation domain-containing protein
MFNYFNKIKYLLKNKQKGMTLVELLVVISIFLLLSSIIMFDYNNFQSSVSLQNLSNDIALSVRKAQSYAIGVRAVNDDFSYPRGIHFTTGEFDPYGTESDEQSFIIFSDINGNHKYDQIDNVCGNPEEYNECQEKLSIKSSDLIKFIYLGDNPNDPKEGIIDITFKRPDPDAIFCYRIDEGDGTCEGNFSVVSIEISNGMEDEEEITRLVKVWNTGQISSGN